MYVAYFYLQEVLVCSYSETLHLTKFYTWKISSACSMEGKGVCILIVFI